MGIIDTLAWRAVNSWLRRYCSRLEGVRHCFVRHSTALEPQDVFLSDHDLAFFVDARDVSELRAHTIRIQGDMKKARVLDAIVLPASDAVYRLCAGYYVQRSRYPMKNWRRVHGEPLALPDTPYHPPPLDHCPESFLYSYLVPAIRGTMPRHRFEEALIRRKFEREEASGDGVPGPGVFGLYDAVACQVRTWDRFYGAIDLRASEETVRVHPTGRRVCEPFADRWASSGASGKGWRAVKSVWVYPGVHNDLAPHVVVNFEPSVSAADCEASLAIVLRTFHGLEFSLLVGTERAMLARLGGLGRVSLLEPWLCSTFGQRLYGDPDLRNRIRYPSVAEVKKKLREYFLYLAYRVFPGSPCPYWLYRLCFTADHLFQRRELVLDAEDLAGIYGQDFLPESGLAGSHGKERLLDAWKGLHGLDPFGPDSCR